MGAHKGLPLTVAHARDGLALTVAGISLGIVAGIAMGHVMGTMLFGVGPWSRFATPCSF